VSLEVDLLHRIETLTQRLEDHLINHPLEHHDHLMDLDDHIAHHKELDEKRKGERRAGERRTSKENYEGEERRSA
jgi:hypothetical protein